jgi:hypothetical protein
MMMKIKKKNEENVVKSKYRNGVKFYYQRMFHLTPFPVSFCFCEGSENSY